MFINSVFSKIAVVERTGEMKKAVGMVTFVMTYSQVGRLIYMVSAFHPRRSLFIHTYLGSFSLDSNTSPNPPLPELAMVMVGIALAGKVGIFPHCIFRMGRGIMPDIKGDC